MASNCPLLSTWCDRSIPNLTNGAQLNLTERNSDWRSSPPGHSYANVTRCSRGEWLGSIWEQVELGNEGGQTSPCRFTLDCLIESDWKPRVGIGGGGGGGTPSKTRIRTKAENRNGTLTGNRLADLRTKHVLSLKIRFSLRISYTFRFSL